MTEDIFDFNAEEVQAPEFTAAQPGTYLTRVEEVKVEQYTNKKDESRLRIHLRHSFVDSSRVKAYGGDGTVGGFFNDVYLGNPKGLGFLKNLIEGHGMDWLELANRYKNIGRTVANSGDETVYHQNLAEALNPLFQQLVGRTAETKLTIVTKDQKGETLDTPVNRVKTYVVKSVNVAR